MERVFKTDNFSLNDIESLLICPSCFKKGFTSLTSGLANLDIEKSKLVASVFIKNGISINDLNDDGNLSLIIAAQILDINAINFCVHLNADLDKTDKTGYTALVEAISSVGSEQQKLNVINLLLNSGANPNKPAIINSEIKYPLIEATKLDYVSIVYKLLLYLADPNLKDEKDKCFFDYAREKPPIREVYSKFKKDEKEVIHNNLSGKIMPTELIKLTNQYFLK